MDSKAIERLRKKYTSEQAAQASRGKIITLPEGKTTLRLLPALKRNDIFREAGQHYGVGKEAKRFLFCPDLTNGDACPICEEVSELRKSGDRDDEQLAKRLRAKRTFLWNAVVRKQEDLGVRLLPSGEKIWFQIMGIILHLNDEEGIDVASVLKGHDLIIERHGKGIKTTYQVFSKATASKLSADAELREQWMGDRLDFDKYVQAQVKSYDQLADILGGGEADPEGDEEGDEEEEKDLEDNEEENEEEEPEEEDPDDTEEDDDEEEPDEEDLEESGGKVQRRGRAKPSGVTVSDKLRSRINARKKGKKSSSSR